MIKILSIGNSFSEDAHAYLKGVCAASGEDIYCANLYIGGCSLIRHRMNMKENIADYTLVINGGEEKYPEYTVEKGLLHADWDFITFQEHSLRSCEFYHFQPFLDELIAYAKKLCPKAKIALHMSWAYNENILHSIKHAGIRSVEEMFEVVDENYCRAFENSDAELVIPSGRVIKRLWKEGYNIHRDNQHISYGIGRYALALTWMRALTGRSPIGNSFRDFSSFVSREEIEAAQRAAAEVEIPKKLS